MRFGEFAYGLQFIAGVTDDDLPHQRKAVALRIAASLVEVRSGKGSLLLKHPTTGKEVWVAVHTKKDAGRLGHRILREAGVE